MIGGAPAAAVVFARDVEQAHAAIPGSSRSMNGSRRRGGRAPAAARERAALWDEVLSQQRGELAAEFDSVHSVERALRMGSISRIIAPAKLRPFLIDAVERGMRRTLERPHWA